VVAGPIQRRDHVVTALVRCNRCGTVTDSWLHLDSTRYVQGMNVNRMRDNPGHDLCDDCGDNFVDFMRELVK
jgi:hypothetical protein